MSQGTEILQAIVYAEFPGFAVSPAGNRYPSTAGTVTDWIGVPLAPAEFHPFRGTFCRMVSVRFVRDGYKWNGRYCPDWGNVVKVTGRKVS